MLSVKELMARRRVRTRSKLRRQRTDRPRLSVFRSSPQISGQVIDDARGQTLVAVSSLDKQMRAELKTGATVEAARAVGKLLAERAREAGVEKVVFDRGGYQFHGRVKALADGAREGGLDF